MQCPTFDITKNNNITVIIDDKGRVIMDKLLRDKKAIVIFVAPAFILFTLVLFIPILQAVYYSFCDYGALTKEKFIGLKNYKELFFKD